MDIYFSGKKLFGDDFSLSQIEQWYNEELEGYANLGSKDKELYSYIYHEINLIHGFSKMPQLEFENVLGFGSAWGDEFEPIASKIKNLTIIEPSDNLINPKIGGVIPKYIKPTVSGELPFEDGTFDLITCFGTLHHIPNVSFVIGELIRVLKPEGFLLLREPIVSMGDWREARSGLTKNERGIPIAFFDNKFDKQPVRLISKQYCFTLTAFLQRNFGFLFKHPIHTYRTYVIMDKIISLVLSGNVRYHATNIINKLAPQAIFFVLQKK